MTSPNVVPIKPAKNLQVFVIHIMFVILKCISNFFVRKNLVRCLLKLKQLMKNWDFEPVSFHQPLCFLKAVNILSQKLIRQMKAGQNNKYDITKANWAKWGLQKWCFGFLFQHVDTSQKLLHPGEKPPMAGLCSHVEKKRDLRSSSRHVFTKFPNTNLRIYRIHTWYFVTRLFWSTVRKNCSSDRGKLLKF